MKLNHNTAILTILLSLTLSAIAQTPNPPTVIKADPSVLVLTLDDQFDLISHDKRLVDLGNQMKTLNDKILATPDGAALKVLQDQFNAEATKELADADRIINAHKWKGHFDFQTQKFVPEKQ